MGSKSVKTIYFAGELFSLKHLAGNALLAEEIDALGGYQCVLPQNLEQRECIAESIRNQDLLKVLECDCALFNFDGPDIDSGTVVELIAAKMLDIPSVIVRTDFRQGGDDKGFPWNLMMSYYPRTEVVRSDGMAEYQKGLASGGMNAAKASAQRLAKEIVAALDRTVALTPTLPKELREPVYQWFRLMPGESFTKILTQDSLQKILNAKIQGGLL